MATKLVWRFTLAWFNETLNYVSKRANKRTKIVFRLCLQFAFNSRTVAMFFMALFFCSTRCVIKCLTHKHTNKQKKGKKMNKLWLANEYGMHQVSWIYQKKKYAWIRTTVAIKFHPKSHGPEKCTSCQLMHVDLFSLSLGLLMCVYCKRWMQSLLKSTS